MKAEEVLPQPRHLLRGPLGEVRDTSSFGEREWPKSGEQPLVYRSPAAQTAVYARVWKTCRELQLRFLLRESRSRKLSVNTALEIFQDKVGFG